MDVGGGMSGLSLGGTSPFIAGRAPASVGELARVAEPLDSS